MIYAFVSGVRFGVEAVGAVFGAGSVLVLIAVIAKQIRKK